MHFVKRTLQSLNQVAAFIGRHRRDAGIRQHTIAVASHDSRVSASATAPIPGRQRHIFVPTPFGVERPHLVVAATKGSHHPRTGRKHRLVSADV